MINWRRGLWRTWLLVSIPWVLLSGWLELPGWFAPEQSTYYYSPTEDRMESWYSNLKEENEFRSGETVAVNFASGVKVVFLKTIFKNKDHVLLASDTPTGEQWARSPIFVPLAESKQSLAPIGDRATKQRRNELLKGLRDATIIILVPPVVLLLIGLAVCWTITGFRTH